MVKISIAGHRPDKLFGYDWSEENNKKLMKRMKELYKEIMISSLEKQGNRDFTWLLGGSLGIEQMSHYILNELKEELLNINIIIILAEPFNGFWSKWGILDLRRYNHLKNSADKVINVEVEEGYETLLTITENIHVVRKIKNKYKYLVDNSSVLIAWWDGSNGNTKNCVTYADKQNKSIVTINPKQIF